MAKREKIIIGASAFVEIDGMKGRVPAKVDTGADSSSVWASTAFVENKKLHYTLFAAHSPHYDGIEHETAEYKVSRVTSSTGHSERRYKTPLVVKVEGKRLKVWFTLTPSRADRTYPMLIGRRTLHDKFLVDVSQHATDHHKTPQKVRTTS